MISEDTLMTFAELAIALIGFSGVVTALRRTREGKWTRSELLQLRALVEPSLIVLGGALTPIAIQLVISDEQLVWRISNGFLFSVGTLGLILFLRRDREALVTSQKLISAIGAVVSIVLLCSIFDLTSYHALAFFITLSYGLAASILNFCLLLFARTDETE